MNHTTKWLRERVRPQNWNVFASRETRSALRNRWFSVTTPIFWRLYLCSSRVLMHLRARIVIHSIYMPMANSRTQYAHSSHHGILSSGGKTFAAIVHWSNYRTKSEERQQKITQKRNKRCQWIWNGFSFSCVCGNANRINVRVQLSYVEFLGRPANCHCSRSSIRRLYRQHHDPNQARILSRRTISLLIWSHARPFARSLIRAAYKRLFARNFRKTPYGDLLHYPFGHARRLRRDSVVYTRFNVVFRSP